MADFPDLTHAAILSGPACPLSFGLWADQVLTQQADWPAMLEMFHRLPETLCPILQAHGVLQAYHLPAEPFHGQIHLYLVDNAAIQALNVEHRAKDEATDVLSFPMFEPGELADSPLRQLPSNEAISLGDVVISVEFGQKLIANGKPVHAPRLENDIQPLEDSDSPADLLQCNNSDIRKSALNATNVLILRYLIERAVHGSLHVLGYHHASDIEYNQVVSLQKAVLDKLFSAT